MPPHRRKVNAAHAMLAENKLLDQARTAAQRAYAPYSGFRVGVALECTDGTVFRGANVENRSYGLTCCAERSAVFAAVSAGHTDFAAIAIYSPDSARPIPPCGACRQVISEFVGPDFPVRFYASDGSGRTLPIKSLLPEDSLHDLRSKTHP
jgi:cytidine deaminase